MHQTTPPLFEVDMSCTSARDEQKLKQGLQALAARDDLLTVRLVQERPVVAGGWSESHLQDVIGRLRTKYDVDVKVSERRSAYRETIQDASELDFTHKRQTGGSGEFARICLTIGPSKSPITCCFESKIIGGRIPAAYIPNIEKGVLRAAESGTVWGFPVVHCSVRLTDGAYHDVDSSASAFEVAGEKAFYDLCMQAGITLVEPVTTLQITAPEPCAHDIIANLNRRHVRLAPPTVQNDTAIIVADGAVANICGLERDLRMLSDGRATLEAKFSHYQVVETSTGDPFRPAIGARA